MLKILTDECVHTDLVSAIKTENFNILTVSEAGLTGASDENIFDFAVKNQRILLTFDRGFGDIFRFNPSRSSGIIIVLISQMNKGEVINIALKFLSFIKEFEINGKLAIIGRNKIRIISR